MSTFIKAAARGKLVDPEVRPEFRRATRAMRICADLVDSLLKASPVSDRSRLGIILGTSLGELETTTEFLSTMATANLARPLLFQNSLHNATTGFLTLHFKITGPSATISNRTQSSSDTLDLALSWIQDGAADSVLAITADLQVQSLPHSRNMGEHASGLLLSSSASGSIARLDILESTKVSQNNLGRDVLSDLVSFFESRSDVTSLTLHKPLRGHDLITPL